MSKPTDPAVVNGRASRVPALARPIAGVSRRGHPAAQGEGAVLMYTRHTRGTIEAERERRLKAHAGNSVRHVRRPGMSHPRLAAALTARERLETQARADENRWVDEGGWFDPETVGRTRIGNKEMKRCSS